MSYQSTILADSPLWYNRAGTTDLGSLGHTGTIHGSVTTGQTGLLVGDSQTCDLFDGSTGYISASDSGLPTGSAAWSEECWINPVTVSGSPNFFAFGTSGGNGISILFLFADGTFGGGNWGTGGELDGLLAVAGQVYYALSTYDGSNLRLYVGDVTAGTLTSYGPKSVGMNLALSGTVYVGRDPVGDYAHAYIQERALYGTALSSAQATAHWNAGITAPTRVTLLRSHRSIGRLPQGENVYR